MVNRNIRLLLLLIIIITNVINCNGEKDMAEKKRKEFLKILTEQAKITNFEKEEIDFMINRLHRIPLEKMKRNKVNNIEKIKKEIDKEYNKYEIVYTGKLNDRNVVIIGERYKYKSCLKWGVIYDVTDKNILKVGEFNNKGEFLYTGNDKELNPYPKSKLFYVVMFQTNMTFKDILKIDTEEKKLIKELKEFLEYHPDYKEDLSIKMDIIITETYYESLAYGMGFVRWYNKKVKKWKWLMINTWF